MSVQGGSRRESGREAGRHDCDCWWWKRCWRWWRGRALDQARTAPKFFALTAQRKISPAPGLKTPAQHLGLPGLRACRPFFSQRSNLAISAANKLPGPMTGPLRRPASGLLVSFGSSPCRNPLILEFSVSSPQTKAAHHFAVLPPACSFFLVVIVPEFASLRMPGFFV